MTNGKRLMTKGERQKTNDKRQKEKFLSSSVPNYFFFISFNFVSPDLLPATYFLGELSGILI